MNIIPEKFHVEDYGQEEIEAIKQILRMAYQSYPAQIDIIQIYAKIFNWTSNLKQDDHEYKRLCVMLLKNNYLKDMRWTSIGQTPTYFDIGNIDKISFSISESGANLLFELEAQPVIEKMKNDFMNELEKKSNEINKIYPKMIEIFGIFIAIFSIITISANTLTQASYSVETALVYAGIAIIIIIVPLITLILLIEYIIKKGIS